MRVLEFNVDKQRLKKEESCDFDSIVRGTRKYLHIKFNFSKEWESCYKVVSFWSNEQEYAVQLDNDICEIPHEVLLESKFKVSVIGGRDDGYRITTNKITIVQEG